MKSLRADAEKSTISNIIIVLLLAIGFSSFPTTWVLSLFSEDSITASLYVNAICKFLFSGILVYLIYSYEFKGMIKFGTKKIYLLIPCFLVVVNNFPFIAIFTGEAVFFADALTMVGYVLYSLSVAFFEELAFRGLVLPLVFLKTKERKHGLFLSLLISSLLFGAVHIVNFFGGANIGAVLLQMCYSFLIGGMCAVATCLTGGVFVAVLLHFVFNFGGLFIDTLGKGNIWNIPTIIITAVLGIIVAVYMIIVALKLKDDTLKNMIDLK